MVKRHTHESAHETLASKRDKGGEQFKPDMSMTRSFGFSGWQNLGDAAGAASTRPLGLRNPNGGEREGAVNDLLSSSAYRPGSAELQFAQANNPASVDAPTMGFGAQSAFSASVRRATDESVESEGSMALSAIHRKGLGRPGPYASALLSELRWPSVSCCSCRCCCWRWRSWRARCCCSTYSLYCSCCSWRAC